MVDREPFAVAVLRGLVRALVVVALLAGTGTARAFEPLPRGNPADHQVDPAALTAAFDAAENLGFMRGMVVVRDGHVLGERHWTGFDTVPLDVRSVTKSVMSILLGIAIDRGDVGSVRDRLVDYLPPSLTPSDPGADGITLWHILTQSTGFEWNEDAEVVAWLSSPTPTADILARPLVAEPGTVFNYNTAATHLMSVVISEATGMSTLEYADQHLFGPLGITDRRWLTAGSYENGGAGLKLRTEDAAKLGILFVDGGEWHGEQVVPRWWVNASTFPNVHGLGSFGPLTEIHYGWLWWLDRGGDHHMYTGWGWGGQFVFCVPALRLVVATHSPWSVDGDTADQQEAAVLDVIVDRVLPAVTDRRVLTATGIDVPELAPVDDMMRDLVREHEIRHATAAVVRDGRLVLARGYTLGEPDVDPVEPTALFRTGSIAKSLTSVAVHQLVERGALGLETRVFPALGIEPLPGWTADPLLDTVTVDHLLAHVSGLYSEDDIYRILDLVPAAAGTEPPPTTEETLSWIIGHPFRFAPETDWDYNNYGYLALGQLVERSTGEPFVRHLQNALFRPLGVGRARQAHRLRSELAPTEVDYDGLEGDPYRSIVDSAAAAGGLVMAAPDLARVYSALFDRPDAGGLVSPATRATMLELPFPVSQLVGYGRGWYHERLLDLLELDLGTFLDLDDGLDVYGHGGGGSGVFNIALWRSDRTTAVLFTNTDPVTDTVPFPDIPVWPDHDLWSTVGIGPGPAPPAPTEAFVPVVASVDGVGGSVWRSDVGLLNRSTLANRVRLRYLHDGGFHDLELELAPAQYRTVEDVVGGLGLDGAGPLQAASSEPLTVTSRTFNQASGGTFGQFLGAEAPESGIRAGDTAVLVGLAENDAARCNIGVTNGGLRDARVAVTLFDGSGDEIAGLRRTVAPGRNLQLARPFLNQGGRDDLDSGYAVVTLESGSNTFVYASVVDNVTGDPTTIPATRSAGSTHQWVAAAASVDGVGGSRWRTTLAILNADATTASVGIRFHGDDGSTAQATFAAGPGEQLMLRDVLGQLGATGTGALEITADTAILVGSRTFNLAAGGTFGQYLGGLAEGAGAVAGESRWLPQLRQNDSFRTNLGLLNAGTSGARVRVRLLDADGTELAVRQRTLAGGERIQLQEPYARIAGRDDLDDGYAVVEVLEGAGVHAYASVVDNRTNDPTTIPAIR